jgi:hypothetical protein
MILYVLSFREDSLPKVHVKDISSAHLISYHPNRDLLPRAEDMSFTWTLGKLSSLKEKSHRMKNPSCLGGNFFSISSSSYWRAIDNGKKEAKSIVERFCYYFSPP